MNILIYFNSKLPAIKYGGTQRVVYYLAQELIKLNHDVTLLIKGVTKEIPIPYIIYNPNKSFNEQVPKNTDIVHIHSDIPKDIKFPYIVTMHGNKKDKTPLDKNTVFVSSNHAKRYGSTSYVYNGLNWDDYTKVDFSLQRKYYHFLGNAAWKIKNVKGAIQIAKKANEHIKILGGIRFNIKMGIRFTWTTKASFFGMVGGEEKNSLINGSKGLIFPVLWNEPFGLAIIESLYYGCPVFGTPYGSLPELVPKEVGFLSSNQQELIEAIKNNNFDRYTCHQYAKANFNSKLMAERYLKKYKQAINKIPLNADNPVLLETQKDKYLHFK